MPDDIPAYIPEDIPAYIPEDVQSAHLDGARQQIAIAHRTDASHRRASVQDPGQDPSPDASTPPSGRLAPGRVGAIAAAAVLGVVGLLGLSVAFTWLAVTSGEAIWIAFSVGGWITTAAVPGVLAGLWWRRSDTTPRLHLSGDAR